ncbi:HIT family protein [Candidatus Woesearchaeota archaeon]|nr:HIT family protein [Candidatus Woesearchaeota archaeon]
MKCELCELIQDQRNVICAEQDVIAAVRETAVTPGQIIVFPRQHFTIFEIVPDPILQKCVFIANKIGMAVFDSLGAAGTNILIQNGIGAGQTAPHFALDIIPRRENDTLPLQWKPQQLMEEEMDTAFIELKEQIDKGFVTDTPKEIPAPKKEKIGVTEGKNNYLLKSLRRMP